MNSCFLFQVPLFTADTEALLRKFGKIMTSLMYCPLGGGGEAGGGA